MNALKFESKWLFHRDKYKNKYPERGCINQIIDYSINHSAYI